MLYYQYNETKYDAFKQAIFSFSITGSTIISAFVRHNKTEASKNIPAKALQIAAATSLVKRFCADSQSSEIIIKKSQDVLSLTYDLRDKKKEYLVCLYLDARNVLIKKEVISMGLVDKTLFQLQNRRYIGHQYKLIEWIFFILDKECEGKSFTDIFAGTGARKLQFNQITI